MFGSVEKKRGRIIGLQTSRWIYALLICVWALPAAAQTFTSSFNREFLQVGQPAVLSLTFEGISPDNPPPAPQIPGAQAYYNGSSKQWTSINGVARVTQGFNYLVMPSKAGELVVPEIKVNVDGRVLTAPSLRIKVITPEGLAEAEKEIMEKLAFIKVRVPKTEAYVGEVVPAEIKVYATAADNLQLHQFKAEGFTLGKASHTTQSREQLEGRQYHVVTFHMPIAARMVGRLPVGPAECTLNVRIPTSRPDPIRDPFRRNNMRPMRITSETEYINVLPLPTENVPANFNGAVGQFSMAVDATPTQLPAGDPITYTVQIQARGTLDDLKLPEQKGWREFRTYPPTSTVSNKDALGISGIKQFEQIVIPTHAEIKELPPFHFSFFDPEQRQYRTLTQPAIPLTIQPNTTPVAQPSYVGSSPFIEPEPEQERADDIAHIEPRLGSTMASSFVLIRTPWFYLLQILPITVWLGVFVQRKRKERIARDPKLQRRRQVERLVSSGLKELNLLAERGEAESFYETTLRLLKEQLGEYCDLPAVSITEDIIDEKLKPEGIPEEQLARFHELFQACNHARYAGEISASDLHQSATELESAINDLKQIRSA